MSAHPLPKDDSVESRARIVGHVELDNTRPDTAGPAGDDFLTEQAAAPWSGAGLKSDSDRILAEIRELQAENRWDDIIALFHPVEEKASHLVESGLAGEVRLKVGFALCRAGRHDEALQCLGPVAETEPENALAHYTIGYTALDALFLARTSRRPLPRREKKQLFDTADTHFERACGLRPDSVTFFYRHGVLFKEIGGKPRRAIPLLKQAMANWEARDEATRKEQHQQFPKYIKAMYHLASCYMKDGRPALGLPLVEKVLKLDRDRDHMAPVFKHFAMGKLLHALGRPAEALEHLETAAYRAEKGQPVDFVHELAARCALLLDRPEQAARHIERIPARARRPYVRWTEADVLVARGRRDQALRVLAETAERDRRGRHKALIRMARIHMTQCRYGEAEQRSREAAEFCRESFGNPSHEALFWQAAALYRLGRFGEALRIVEELEECSFRYPNFHRLAELVRRGGQEKGGERGLSLVR